MNDNIINLIEDSVNQKVWAVVGVSQNKEKFGYKIFKSLKEAGYTVYPIHPSVTSVDGFPCYANLSALPEKPQVVDLVVPPSVAEKIIDECIKEKIERVWFQPGAENKEAIEKAQKAGIKVVFNACALVEKKNWCE